MSGLRHAIVLGIGLLALTFAGAARAQDLSAGKTPAQLFQLNCSICHKSARGLAAAGKDKGSGLFSGLEDFLAEHYTADPKSAQIIAAYLRSVGGAAPTHARQHRRAAKPHKPAAKSEAKSDAKASTKSETAKKTDDKKADKSTAKTSTDSEGGKAKAEAPKVETSEKPAMAKPAAAAADTKKPASASTQAKDAKPVAGDKKTD